MIKHFIDISDLNKDELKSIIHFAKKLKTDQSNYKNLLNQKSLGMIFEKQSLRTRVSFDIAMQNIGGNVIELDPNSIGFNGRESTQDIINALSQYLDCLLIRNNDHEKIKQFASYNYLPIINGLSNYSHPCEILSDIFTIEEFKGSIEKLIITWCGDINNVSIALLQASKILGFTLRIAAPKEIINEKKSIIDRYASPNIHFFEDIHLAAKDTDCIMTDVWVSMGEKFSEEKINLMRNLQVNDEVMSIAKDDAIFMHCLPAKRNQEVTDSVIDGKNSVIWQQSQNRLFVQQSIINYCIT